MDSRGKRRFWSSFSFAFQGIFHALITERNFQFHSVVSVIVIIISFLLNISKIEWMFIILCIFGMLVLELINTAFERAVDLITNTYHPLAKQAKDVAAAAVFCYSVMTVIIGCIIFIPKLVRIIDKYCFL
ncbi:diacylglycerol kinase family protein [Heyndrickxia sp. NPDC080065]|uniref:diacylglycerol kinase family protein n=1 Tax=Heyndrickxia sp. NPDC080065 TaxID=3390568 RepID=UPI003D01909F